MLLQTKAAAFWLLPTYRLTTYNTISALGLQLKNTRFLPSWIPERVYASFFLLTRESTVSKLNVRPWSFLNSEYHLKTMVKKLLSKVGQHIHFPILSKKINSENTSLERRKQGHGVFSKKQNKANRTKGTNLILILKKSGMNEKNQHDCSRKSWS